MPPREKKVRRIIPISGKDSLCTAIVQTEREPRDDYEYIFCDVKMELPETYAWLDQVEKKLGISITRIGKSLEVQMREVGMIPSSTFRFCTLNTKIKPYQDWIERDPSVDEIVNYIGFRKDEEGRIPRGGVDRLCESRDIVTVREVYPLIEEGVKVDDVYRIIESHGLSVPNFFWKRLHDAVYERCGPTSQKFVDGLPAWTRAHLFNWRSRSNCYLCFYMRLYEWVGLLEHHPKLFDRAEEIERVFGSCNSEMRIERWQGPMTGKADYHFHMGWPLPNVRKEAERIFRTRVDDVYRTVLEGRQKPKVELDLLSSTSCGAYCGK